MRRLAALAFQGVVLLTLSAPGVHAQTETLLYDHVHMSVADPEAAAQWYHDHIGGEWVDDRTDRLLFGTTRIMWLPGGGDRRPSQGGSIDHLGFSFADLDAKLAELEAAGATIQSPRRDVEGLFPIAFAVDPYGVRLELIQDPQHLGFHHVHLRSPDPEQTLAWYQAQFGGVRLRLRGRLDGILYPGNVWILVQEGDTFPTSENVIDHIGWRAIDLGPKVEELRGNGIEITSEPRPMTLPNGQIAFSYLAGPNDTRIELVQRAPDMR